MGRQITESYTVSQGSYSVALCTCNGERFIADQLNSIIGQTVKPGEVIISDDGSSDNTLDIVRSVMSQSDIPYRIAVHEKANGISGNFSYAISLCSFPIVFTSDQDDIWMPDKAEQILRVFSEEPEALLVFSDGELVDENLVPLCCSLWKAVGITQEMLDNRDWFMFLLNKCLITGAAMAFKKELLDENEVIPSSWLHDGWLAWKASVRNGLVPCRKKLILYRQHEENAVGMESVTSVKRVRNYIRNFQGMKDQHKMRLERYKVLKEKMGDTFSKDQLHAVNNCIMFWKDLTRCDRESSLSRRLRCLNWHERRGDFQRFYSGSRGYVREVILAVFHR